MDPQRGPLSLVSITEELVAWKTSGSGSINPGLTTVGIRCADHATPSIHKTSPTSDGRWVDIVRLLTKATVFFSQPRGKGYERI
jgi:hypothetical protein